LISTNVKIDFYPPWQLICTTLEIYFTTVEIVFFLQWKFIQIDQMEIQKV